MPLCRHPEPRKKRQRCFSAVWRAQKTPNTRLHESDRSPRECNVKGGHKDTIRRIGQAQCLDQLEPSMCGNATRSRIRQRFQWKPKYAESATYRPLRHLTAPDGPPSNVQAVLYGGEGRNIQERQQIGESCYRLSGGRHLSGCTRDVCCADEVARLERKGCVIGAILPRNRLVWVHVVVARGLCRERYARRSHAHQRLRHGGATDDSLQTTIRQARSGPVVLLVHDRDRKRTANRA